MVKGTIDAASLCTAAPLCPGGVGDWSAFVAALDAGTLYLNVHTTQFPAGEVRGQVHAGHEG